MVMRGCCGELERCLESGFPSTAVSNEHQAGFPELFLRNRSCFKKREDSAEVVSLLGDGWWGPLNGVGFEFNLGNPFDFEKRGVEESDVVGVEATENRVQERRHITSHCLHETKNTETIGQSQQAMESTIGERRNTGK